jgi:prophage regulatory protein
MNKTDSAVEVIDARRRRELAAANLVAAVERVQGHPLRRRPPPTYSNADPDPVVGEAERRAITGYSRQHWARLEAADLVPKRIRLGSRKVGWYLRELLAWRDGRAALRDGGTSDAAPTA